MLQVSRIRNALVMKNLWIFCGLAFALPLLGYAQKNVSGTVYSLLDGKTEPLPGAIVSWQGAANHVTTANDGTFSIAYRNEGFLIAAFAGFKPDTQFVESGTSQVNFTLIPKHVKLAEVVVRDKQQASALKQRDVGVTQLITSRELTKAACCNLSESFETNPAIDANFTDAITGTRQIRLLGLDGPYSLYTRGNIPTMWGLASVLGLQLIPGSWIQSIQLTKGSGSVMNSYESISGQVNYELRQPDAREKLYLQLYANAGGRLEQSVVYPIKLSDTWSTNVMLYGRQQVSRPDFNADRFVDMPQGGLYIFQNTWKHQGLSGWETQFGVKYVNQDQQGGQVAAFLAEAKDSLWVAKMQTKRFEYWHKLGYVFPKSNMRSIGFQWAFNWHDQRNTFGLAQANPTFTGQENDFYFNVIFQDIIKTTDHQYKIGATYKFQNMDERFDQQYRRREQIPGIFGEYTYLFLDQLSVVTGMRVDFHNLYGTFFTPRLHVRYAPFKHHTFRFNVGKAYRTPNLFADHLGLMASNRMWAMQQDDADLPYAGIKQEESINAGLSYAYSFEWDYRPGAFRAEYFYTTFQNQLVKDWDASVRQINFYNLSGESFVHNLQFQFDYEIVQRLNARVAYRYVDARTTYNSIGLAQQPFIATHRAFINADYQTRNAWKFDITANAFGKQRLPTTRENPTAYQRADESPAYATMHLQISKVFREVLDLHIGVENVFDYRQPNPIVAADDPFAPQFDASMVWGPIMGRVIYVGARFSVL